MADSITIKSEVKEFTVSPPGWVPPPELDLPIIAGIALAVVDAALVIYAIATSGIKK